jgi:hypothetical protein
MVKAGVYARMSGGDSRVSNICSITHCAQSKKEWSWVCAAAKAGVLCIRVERKGAELSVYGNVAASSIWYVAVRAGRSGVDHVCATAME